MSASANELAEMNPEPPTCQPGAGSVGFELEEILTATRETAYRWDFASDRFEWA